MNSTIKNATITLRWSMDYDFFAKYLAKEFPKEKREVIWNSMCEEADHHDKKKDEFFYDMEDTDCPENRAQEIVEEQEEMFDEAVKNGMDVKDE